MDLEDNMYKHSFLIHKDSKSKYKGGFITKNGRKNNSKEYNHDYYMRNKEKWKSEETLEEDILEEDTIQNETYGEDFFDKNGRLKVNPQEYSFVGKEQKPSKVGKDGITELGVNYYEKNVDKWFSTDITIIADHNINYRGSAPITKAQFNNYKQVGKLERAYRKGKDFINNLFNKKGG